MGKGGVGERRKRPRLKHVIKTMITLMSCKILAADVKAQQKRLLKFKIQWYCHVLVMIRFLWEKMKMPNYV
jgi:hypothetical protein